jgi:hypothetical protein
MRRVHGDVRHAAYLLQIDFHFQLQTRAKARSATAGGLAALANPLKRRTI